jgi:hypothetical protein
MRRAVLVVASAVLLIGPTVLAFFKGGYFDGPRLVAAAVAWLLVLVVAVLGTQPLPSSWAGRAALGGLALIACWSGISLAWAPLGGAAIDNVTRLLLYLGVVVAAAGLLRDRLVARALEPALAAGAVVVIGYGLLGRLLPGWLDLPHSSRASGRLEQPITYWNAEGALAAMGLVLAARLAGDRSRPVSMRAAGAAAAIPLGLGVYLSYSRGAIAAAIIGLVVLVSATRSRSQAAAAGVALAASLVAALVSTGFPGVASLEGTLAERERDGAIVLGLLLMMMPVAGLVQARLARAEPRGRLSNGRLLAQRALPTIGVAVFVIALLGLVGSGLAEHDGSDPRSDIHGPGRLTAVDSSRYDYWRVGANALVHQPLIGTGSGGYRVVWLRDRTINDYVLEVHSLPLEMGVELGIVGLIAFGLFVGGVVMAARRALRSAPELAAGPVAVFAVWFLHTSIDWDWQLPAVSLVALIAVGAIVAAGELPATRPEAREELEPLRERRERVAV